MNAGLFNVMDQIHLEQIAELEITIDKRTQELGELYEQILHPLYSSQLAHTPSPW